jgi:hypothetical protein
MVDDGVKPNFQPEQNTLILRDIPSNTPNDEVLSIFNFPSPLFSSSFSSSSSAVTDHEVAGDQGSLGLGLASGSGEWGLSFHSSPGYELESGLSSYESCPPAQSVRADMNDTW